MTLTHLIGFDCSNGPARIAPSVGFRRGRLEKQAALINGSDKATCRSIALSLASEGARIAICNSKDAEDAEETCRLINASGGTCILLAGACRGRKSCRRLIEEAVSRLGALDILVNCAEIDEASHSDQLSRIEASFRSITFPYSYFMTTALPYMPAGGTVINATGIAWERGTEPPDYAAVISAIKGLTRSFARVVASRGIRVNAIAHSPGDGAANGADIGADPVHGSGPDHSRNCQVGPTCVFLASSDAAHLTGQIFYMKRCGRNATASVFHETRRRTVPVL
jgi:NAD(P)-dependent dehydrogenase (short-subunit alcohol dehydrogenase family)